MKGIALREYLSTEPYKHYLIYFGYIMLHVSFYISTNANKKMVTSGKMAF